MALNGALSLIEKLPKTSIAEVFGRTWALALDQMWTCKSVSCFITNAWQV